MTKTKIALFAIPILAAVLIGASLLPVHAQEEIKARVAMDIKPGSCPNSINTHQKGLVSVAILGGKTLGEKQLDVDVEKIDTSSLLLIGVEPAKISYENVATPYTDPIKDEFSCNTKGPDGIRDLVLKFETQKLVASMDAKQMRVKAISEQDKTASDGVILTLTGKLIVDEKTTIEIEGQDVILLRDQQPTKEPIKKPIIVKKR